MKLGIWTPIPHAIAPEPRLSAAIHQAEALAALPYRDETFAFAREVVCRADQLGFDITLIAERLLGPDLEAWMLSAALVSVAPRIEIMTAVHPGLLAPQFVAKMGASLDRISGGRFHLNLVPGWFEEEYRMFGGAWTDDPAVRYSRMQEFLQVVKGLWTELRFSFHGLHYQLDDAVVQPRPVQQPYPPIYAASRTEGGMDVIAREGNWWFLPHGAGFRDFPASLKLIATAREGMAARAARYGRTLRYGISVHVICRPTQEEAVAAAERLEAHGQANRIARIAALALGAGLVGTYETVAERMLAYHAAGVDLFLMHFSPMLPEMERFAAEVLPRLRASATPRATGQADPAVAPAIPRA